MKTNFKKTLAVLLAVLMLTSVFSVTVFAAGTVTYKPGEGEGIVGEEQSFSYGRNHTVIAPYFTRPHFTQIGWVDQNGNFKNTGDKVSGADYIFTPVWQGDVYKLTYDPGQYGTGSVVVVDAEYGSSAKLNIDIIYTREGYVQDGWSLVDGGEKVYELGAFTEIIEGDLTVYPYWAQKYSITFTPGQFGVGEEVSMLVEAGRTYTSKNALFTRDGYMQTGWSLEEGGRKICDLVEPNIVAEQDTVWYPFWEKKVFGVSVSASDLYFGDLCKGYVTPDAKSITITNIGNMPATVTVSELSNYTMSESGTFILAMNESKVITVQPKDNLGLAVYNESIEIEVAEDSTMNKVIDVVFSVSEHVFGNYVPNDDATYSSDGTKTAKCVKGCGETDNLPNPGSKKVYDAANNTAKGLVSSYVHHRTVRFTAYGSGMDAVESDNLTKRFRPVNWYVNDDFNGEFTGNDFEGTDVDGDGIKENLYDVTFTHTIFGSYTLTINYVEEVYDSATGEWVETDVTDTKTFDYTVGTNEYEEQEIVRPNTILNIIFGLFAQLLALLGIGG